MKTLTLTEFETMTARTNWTREQSNHPGPDYFRFIDEFDDEGNPVEQTCVLNCSGYASKTSTLNGVKITYYECYSFDKSDGKNFWTGTGELEAVWTIEGARVEDTNGNEMDAHEACDSLSYDFRSIDYKAFWIADILKEQHQ